MEIYRVYDDMDFLDFLTFPNMDESVGSFRFVLFRRYEFVPKSRCSVLRLKLNVQGFRGSSSPLEVGGLKSLLEYQYSLLIM